MKEFKDLGIQSPNKFKGDKMDIWDIVNRKVTVEAFKIGPSKFLDKGSGLRLDLQIQLDGIQYVVWTGSTVLMEQIKMVSEKDFPFSATIVKEHKALKFT